MKTRSGPPAAGGTTAGPIPAAAKTQAAGRSARAQCNGPKSANVTAATAFGRPRRQRSSSRSSGSAVWSSRAVVSTGEHKTLPRPREVPV